MNLILKMENLRQTSQFKTADTNNILGRKRKIRDISNNLIFRPFLKGILEGENEKTAHLFKNIFSFDWDDENVVKPKMHPRK